MVLASSSVGELLLILKIAFLVLLFLFIWRVIRTAAKEPQAKASAGGGIPSGGGSIADSMILTPAAAQAAGLGPKTASRPRHVFLVVERSPSLETDAEIHVGTAPVTVGRGSQNDLVLDGDEFASSRHAQIEARGDGMWVQDLDSTNGTFVNGERVVGAERMHPGDVLRIGETDLRVEED